MLISRFWYGLCGVISGVICGWLAAFFLVWLAWSHHIEPASYLGTMLFWFFSALFFSMPVFGVLICLDVRGRTVRKSKTAIFFGFTMLGATIFYFIVSASPWIHLM